ncbi:hypothetical protein Fcan01_20534 [Folsomia candida]|uniref:Uncharacterized protein n=1 Tax=Folsomia candida TaxID=158441 RepID=A0A226DH84_FOLCA|nr:hypothetical protein Fcan01_20534 [Folsomia candida]
MGIWKDPFEMVDGSPYESYFNHTALFDQVYTTFFLPGKIADDYEIAKLSNFDEFMGFYLLRESLLQGNWSTPNQRQSEKYDLGQNQELVYGDVRTDVIILERRSFGFLSCHGVGVHSTRLAPILSPFDYLTWTFILTSLLVTVLLLNIANHAIGAISFFFVIAVSLENSILAAYQNIMFPKTHKLSIQMIVSVYLLLLGTTLPAWYKTSFTMEMIVLPEISVPWRTMMDVRNFKFYIALESILDDLTLHNFSKQDLLELFDVRVGMELHLRTKFQGNSKILQEYRNVAKTLYDGTFINRDNNADRLIYPVSYSDPDTFVEKISTCEKVGYMDSTENLEKLVPYLNDNKKGKIFMLGESGFFSWLRGWQFFPVKGSHTFKRFKGMVSSGIYSHWEKWYEREKPVKLFRHYANWKFPKVSGTVPRLDFNSKISTAFDICGVLFLLSCVVLLLEMSVHGSEIGNVKKKFKP